MISPLPIINFNPQLDFNQIRNDLKCGPPVCPFNDFGAFGDFGTESLGMGHHIDSPQIEPIRIPTSLDRNVGIRMPFRMQAAGSMEQIEILVGKVEHFASEFHRQIDTTFAVTVTADFTQQVS
jgi:hypothetical protein